MDLSIVLRVGRNPNPCPRLLPLMSWTRVHLPEQSEPPSTPDAANVLDSCSWPTHCRTEQMGLAPFQIDIEHPKPQSLEFFFFFWDCVLRLHANLKGSICRGFLHFSQEQVLPFFLPGQLFRGMASVSGRSKDAMAVMMQRVRA